MSYVLLNGSLVTMTGKNLGIIENGAVGFTDGEIDYVGPTSKIEKNDYEIQIDATHKIIMPGLINCHFHSSSTLLRGGAQDVPEIEWMNKAIGPLGKNLSDEDKILGSKISVMEGIRSGTTTFGEYTRNVGSLLKKVHSKIGSRVVAAETINEISSERSHLKPSDLYEFDRTKGEKEFKIGTELIAKYRDHQNIDIMYGPQALDMISLEVLKSIFETSQDQNVGIHMHVAQGERERLQIKGRYGLNETTISVLKNNNLLTDNLLGAHMHDTDMSERKLLIERGVKLASCQSSIAMIDGQVSPISDYLELNGIAGLGTDQAPGPGNHNLIREMRTASLLAKVVRKDPTALPCWEVLKVATIGGAKALGIEDKVGSLETGKYADIITVDLKSINLVPYVNKPFHTFIPNLVYSANGSEIDNVFINGEHVFSESNFLGINQKEIIKQAQKRASIIFEDATSDWRNANSKLVEAVNDGNL